MIEEPRNYMRIVLFIIISSALIGCAAQVKHTEINKERYGEVVNPNTGEPITGANIIITCSQRKFIHGTKVIKEQTITSDEYGVFRLKIEEFNNCHLLDFRVKKKGMFEVREVDGDYYFYTGPEYKSVPKRMFMLPDSEKGNLMEAGTFEVYIQGVTHNKSSMDAPVKGSE